MKIKYQSDSSATRPPPLMIKHQPSLGGQVIIESRVYTKVDINMHKLNISDRRMEQLADLLQTAKSSEFRTLPCLRWFHNRQESSYGQRFLIAHRVGEALLKWHTAGWVHQGIASKNVWFFYSQQDSICKIDYSEPYLFGFAFARQKETASSFQYVAEFEDNAYRHPDRQGSAGLPTMSHTKEHDLYAYGVFLLELGLWNLVTKFITEKDKQNAHKMKDRIVKIAERLGHSMGNDFKGASMTCLKGDFGHDKAESNLTKVFELKVLDPIHIDHHLDTPAVCL
ncbi:hypothetical protein LAWI1_G008646, partial [Lachnellula willkommii]